MSDEASSTCPMCGTLDPVFIGTKHEVTRSRGLLHLLRCRTCRFVYLQERQAEFADEIYDYYARRMGRPRNQLYDPITTRRYHALSRRLSALAPGRRLLDVGCGQGHWIWVAQELGWNALGIDLSEPAIDICQELGAPGQHRDFFDEVFTPESYDLITMFELVEHLPNPMRFIRRAEELLAPGGLLYLTTPNYDSLDRRALGLAWEPIHAEHVNYFTPDTLSRLLEASPSLQCVEMRTQNVSLKGIERALCRPIDFLFRPRSEESQSVAEPDPDQVRQAHEGERAFRARLESSALLRTLKGAANTLLSRAQLGATVTVLVQRSPAASHG